MANVSFGEMVMLQRPDVRCIVLSMSHYYVGFQKSLCLIISMVIIGV